jgi:ParB family chromosome partitioning protein
MTLSSALVSVRKIKPSEPRSCFSEEAIEKIAKAVLDAEGIINPIIVRRINEDPYVYEVANGNLEYYAANRAREIDPLKGETINTFILEPENEKVLTKQVDILREKKSSDNSVGSNISERFTNLEIRIETQFKELINSLNKQNQSLQSEIQSLKDRIPRRYDPLEIFNEKSELEIQDLLDKAGLRGKNNAKVSAQIMKIRKKEKFKNLEEVVARTTGFTEKRMLTVINIWLTTLFL